MIEAKRERCVWIPPYCRAGVVVAIVAAVAVLGYVGVTIGLEPCSTEIEQEDYCTTARKCNKLLNPGCLTMIIVTPKDVCMPGGLPADNCVDSENTQICAGRHECDDGPFELTCVTGYMTGTASVYIPIDGGNCIIE